MIALALLGCQANGLSEWVDDFESYSTEDEVLTPGADWGWSEHRTREGNRWELVDDRVFEGAQSVQFFAESTEGTTSKSSLFINDLLLREGTTVSLEAAYFLTGDSGRPFLLDLEEDTIVGAGPGIRLWLDETDALMLERKKMAMPDVRQPPDAAFTFPRDQWVVVRMDVALSQRNRGWIEVFQDDVRVLRVDDTRTLPKDQLYLIQGSRGLYTNAEFGITAAGVGAPVELWLDAVSVKTLDSP